MQQSVQIAVIGPGECPASVARIAEDVGRGIARAGAVLVCGGLGGVMEAAARGAKHEGGVTLGLLPGSRRADGNPYLDCVVATGLGHFRNFIIAHTADALIAVGGRYGTLSEIAMALTLGKEVFGLTTWEIDGVQRASTVEDAVQRAVQAAQGDPSPT
jgi:hypothetical protein